MLVVDTSVLIEHMQGSKAATALLRDRAADDEVVIPSIVAWEMWKGAETPQARDRLDTLLAAFDIDPLNAAIARLAGELHVVHLRAGTQRPAMDLLIAAHALYHGTSLATCDRGFEAVEGLRLVRVPTRRQG